MPEALSPAERSRRARMAAHVLHSRYDSKELTKPARAAFDDRFLNEVDPDRVLPEAERRRRAQHAKQAHMQGLAIRSAQARKARGR
jgi:hypothetical protein